MKTTATHPSQARSIYRQDWTCHHAERHDADQPFIPCQDCYRPRYSPDQADSPRQDSPRPYVIRAGREYFRFGYGWTLDPNQATVIHGTRAELRHAIETWPATSPAITFEEYEQ